MERMEELIVSIQDEYEGKVILRTKIYTEEEYKKLEEENKKLKKECEENEYLVYDNARWMKRCEEKITEIKKLKEEVEQLKNKRIFSSAEYDLITLTSTTPQWELRRK